MVKSPTGLLAGHSFAEFVDSYRSESILSVWTQSGNVRHDHNGSINWRRNICSTNKIKLNYQQSIT